MRTMTSKKIRIVSLSLAAALACAAVPFINGNKKVSVQAATIMADANGDIQIGGFYMSYPTEGSVKLLHDAGLDYMLLDNWLVSTDGQSPNTKYQATLDSDHLKTMLGYFDKYDMKVLLNMKNNRRDLYSSDEDWKASLTSIQDLTVDYTQYPAFAGFDIFDEPGEDDVLTTGDNNFLKTELDSFLNSNYKDYLFGVTTLCTRYDEYVEGNFLTDGTKYLPYYVNNYLSKVDQKILAYDAYAMHWENSGDHSQGTKIIDNHLMWLDLYGDTARDAGADLCYYVQTYAFNNSVHNVSRADFEFQVFSALAFGAKNIRYFTMHTPKEVDGSSVPTDAEGPLAYLGYPTRTYDSIKSMNAEIKSFSKEYVKYMWQGVMTNGSSSQFDNVTNSLLTSNSRLTNKTSTQDLIIGVFNSDGLENKDAYVIMNFTDPSHGLKNTVSLTFADATQVQVYKDGEMKVVDLVNGVYTTRLDEGEGQFVIPMA